MNTKELKNHISYSQHLDLIEVEINKFGELVYDTDLYYDYVISSCRKLNASVEDITWCIIYSTQYTDIFDAVFTSENAVRQIVENWIERYE